MIHKPPEAVALPGWSDRRESWHSALAITQSHRKVVRSLRLQVNQGPEPEVILFSLQEILLSSELANHWPRISCPHLARIRGYFCNEMRYINLLFTYLLTYLLRATFLMAKLPPILPTD